MLTLSTLTINGMSTVTIYGNATLSFETFLYTKYKQTLPQFRSHHIPIQNYTTTGRNTICTVQTVYTVRHARLTKQGMTQKHNIFFTFFVSTFYEGATKPRRNSIHKHTYILLYSTMHKTTAKNIYTDLHQYSPTNSVSILRCHYIFFYYLN